MHEAVQARKLSLLLLFYILTIWEESDSQDNKIPTWISNSLFSIVFCCLVRCAYNLSLSSWQNHWFYSFRLCHIQ